MQRVFGALLASYVIVIGATMAVGFWVRDPRSFALHFAMGLVATILTCLIYCVLLTYFVITGKLIKQAVQSAGLEKDLIQQSQKPKARIVLLTALAVGVTLVAALLGAWANVPADQQSLRPFVHMGAEFLALFANLAAFSVSYQEVGRNRRLFQRVFAQVNGDAGSSIGDGQIPIASESRQPPPVRSPTPPASSSPLTEPNIGIGTIHAERSGRWAR